MKTAGLAAALTLVLSGCAMGWYRPNTTEAQFYQDRSACESQAAMAYPVTMVAGPGGYQTPTNTRCTTSFGVTNCQTTPGANVPGVAIDANANNRLAMFGACMRGKGYEFKMS